MDVQLWFFMITGYEVLLIVLSFLVPSIFYLIVSEAGHTDVNLKYVYSEYLFRKMDVFFTSILLY